MRLLVRADLIDEAIRLARLLSALVPEEGEVAGLLALMLLHDARRGARLDESGDLVTLEDQDRTCWDSGRDRRSARILRHAMRQSRPGPYQTPGRHRRVSRDGARRRHDTDWSQIATLYERLADLAPSPVVELNRAVAVAMADGPAAGLAIVDSLVVRASLPEYHLLPAVAPTSCAGSTARRRPPGTTARRFGWRPRTANDVFSPDGWPRRPPPRPRPTRSGRDVPDMGA